MPPDFFLEIDVDGDGKITVQGKRDHQWNANGKTPLFWKAKPTSGITSWTVTIHGDESPFDDNRLDIRPPGSGNGPGGGHLKSHADLDKKKFTYDIKCVRNGKDCDSDPEIVVWPD